MLSRSAPTRGGPVVPLLLLSLLAGMALLCMTIGSYDLSTAEVIQTLFQGQASAAVSTAQLVVWEIRLPRVLAAIIFGIALAMSGVVYQALFRNPLVSPDILGVSSGAALGAIAAIFLSWPVWAIYLNAFVAGLVVVALVWLIASRIKGTDPLLTMVLIGIVIGALAGSATSLLKILADPYDQLPAMTFWLLGSLSGVARQEIGLGVALILIFALPLVMLRWRLNLLVLPDDDARSMGVNLQALRLLVVICATMMTACVVSMAGVVGWIGLLVPHVARLMVGSSLAVLLPTSALLGACLLLGIDTLARTLGNTETPLGVLTAIIGAPVFIAALLHARRQAV